MGQARPKTVCPICAKVTAPRPPNQAFPFCSAECKLVDLGKWLDGAYRIPGPPASGDDGPERQSPQEDDE